MSFEQTVVHCASPSLCGIKPASLFSIRNELLDEDRIRNLNRTMELQGKHIAVIKRGASTRLLFIYNENLLKAVTESFNAAFYLKSKGYPVEDGFEAVLQKLFERLETQETFPHEIGLFLGYPMEDVLGFTANGGKNCRYRGSWAVYGNVETAVSMMKSYTKCRTTCCRLLKRGIGIPDMERNYKVLNGTTGGITK